MKHFKKEHKVFSEPKVHHVWTNIDHEITGSYYKREKDWTVTIVTIVVVGLIIVAVEYLFGDDITNWMRG